MRVSSGSTSTRPDRVLLVDDHPITRAGMKALVESDPAFVICAEADSVTNAAQLLDETKPDAAIIDISLRGASGLDLIQDLKRAGSTIPILVVSMHDEEFYAARAHRAGAAGYVMKQHACDRILTALRSILSGQTAFSASANIATGNSAKFKRSGGVESLSVREAEVLRLIGQGFATREIAEKLGLSSKTIDTYREHLKLKLNLENSEKLIRFAVQWTAGDASDRT